MSSRNAYLSKFLLVKSLDTFPFKFGVMNSLYFTPQKRHTKMPTSAVNAVKNLIGQNKNYVQVMAKLLNFNHDSRRIIQE